MVGSTAGETESMNDETCGLHEDARGRTFAHRCSRSALSKSSNAALVAAASAFDFALSAALSVATSAFDFDAATRSLALDAWVVGDRFAHPRTLRITRPCKLRFRWSIPLRHRPGRSRFSPMLTPPSLVLQLRLVHAATTTIGSSGVANDDGVEASFFRLSSWNARSRGSAFCSAS